MSECPWEREDLFPQSTGIEADPEPKHSALGIVAGIICSIKIRILSVWSILIPSTAITMLVQSRYSIIVDE